MRTILSALIFGIDSLCEAACGEQRTFSRLSRLAASCVLTNMPNQLKASELQFRHKNACAATSFQGAVSENFSSHSPLATAFTVTFPHIPAIAGIAGAKLPL